MPVIKSSDLKADRIVHDDTKTTNTSSGALVDTARLIALYWLWKSLILIAVVLSPGTGYDTSTELFFNQDRTHRDALSTWMYGVSLRLTRWDGIYFSSFAEDGYVFEQQWAFSWVFAGVSAQLADGAYCTDQAST